MSRFRKIDPRVWNDEKFRRFNDRGKLAFLFVLTHPGMTALGAMRASVAGLAAELGWLEKKFRDALKPAVEEHMVDVNEEALFIGLPKFLRYNEPEGPNSVKKAWPAALDLIPECDEKNRLVVRCRSYLDDRTQEFKDALGDAIWDAFKVPSEMPCHIQEQEQEQEKEKEKEEGHEFHRNSLAPAPPQPSKSENGKDWGKRDWIPFFLHNQNYVSLPVEYLLTPQWWHNLFEQYPRQIGPGTLERVFAFMGRHFIEQPAKRPKTKKGYLQKVANLIRIQLEKDEKANGGRTDLTWTEPQSESMKRYFAERSSGERS